MCIQKCCRYLIFKKQKKKSSPIKKHETAKPSDVDAVPPAFDEIRQNGQKKDQQTKGKNLLSLDGVKKVFQLDKNKPSKKADQMKPTIKKSTSKLAPLQVEPPKEQHSPRSFYNTFLTEHFENAQITNIVIPFKKLDLATAFATSGPEPSEPRSTEEMRADTLYKVLDDFPNLILPPLKDIDHTLPYLRELDLQSTPAGTPAAEGFKSRLKDLLNPLKNPSSGVGRVKASLLDKLLKTQSEEESCVDVKGDFVSSNAIMTLQHEVTPRGISPEEVSSRAPDWEAPPLPTSTAQNRLAVASTQQPQPLVGSIRKKGRTLRQRLKKIKHYFSGSKDRMEQQNEVR
ncbi:unnamed protein product [Cylicocyclus nassatus]|uniref:Uncharacterized protein n=1 Tax=Cylicocyclus nassatus TaxID=53992 RepID=A0AA36DSF5_CYLNA|nr:unnamed protein product [Cylicocyclus nassatus]